MLDSLNVFVMLLSHLSRNPFLNLVELLTELLYTVPEIRLLFGLEGIEAVGRDRADGLLHLLDAR